MSANEYAERIAEFIKHNNIDTNEFTMDQIVTGFYQVQLKALDNMETSEITEEAEKQYRENNL